MSFKKGRAVAILVVTLVLLGTAGCAEWLLASHGAAFTAGWLSNGLIGASGETTCYLNGEPIDCSTVPAEMSP